MYVSVLLAGIFVFSSQVLVYAYISHLYPAAARATAVGAASGFGRLGGISGPLMGGGLLTAGIAYPWGFYIFAGVAAARRAVHRAVNRDPAPTAAAGHGGRGQRLRRAAAAGRRSGRGRSTEAGAGHGSRRHVRRLPAASG